MKQIHVKRNLSGLLIGGLLLACGPAWGGPAFVFPPPFATNCATLTTLAAWIATPNCSVGDKNYSLTANSGFTGTAIPANDPFGITEVTLGNGDIQHTLLLTLNGATGVVAGFAASFSYTVGINSSEVSIAGIDQVRFDTTTGVNPGELGTSVLTPNVGAPFTLTSINGAPMGASVPGEPQLIGYVDTLSVIGAGSLLSSADTLVETNSANIPEPASLALVGLGLSALGFIRRRKER